MLEVQIGPTPHSMLCSCQWRSDLWQSRRQHRAQYMKGNRNYMREHTMILSAFENFFRLFLS